MVVVNRLSQATASLEVWLRGSSRTARLRTMCRPSCVWWRESATRTPTLHTSSAARIVHELFRGSAHSRGTFLHTLVSLVIIVVIIIISILLLFLVIVVTFWQSWKIKKYSFQCYNFDNVQLYVACDAVLLSIELACSLGDDEMINVFLLFLLLSVLAHICNSRYMHIMFKIIVSIE